MIQTVEASIDERGVIRLRGPVHVSSARRAFVIILDEPAKPFPGNLALLSESGLSDWSRPEEDEGWAYLQDRPG